MDLVWRKIMPEGESWYLSVGEYLIGIYDDFFVICFKDSEDISLGKYPNLLCAQIAAETYISSLMRQ